MLPSDKPEWPPLLEPGDHYFKLEGIQVICATDFPTSSRRQMLMDGLKSFVDLIHDSNIRGKLWIDGSFLTGKIDPDDVDIIMYIDHNDYDKFSNEQQQLIELLTDTKGMKQKYHCHVFVEIWYEEGHQFHGSCNLRRLSWDNWWGTSRKGIKKGYAVVEVGDLNV